MNEDGQDQSTKAGRQRVQDYRARRRAAGLIEIRAWVRAVDVDRAHTVLRALTDEAGRQLAGHTRQDRTNHLAVTVRFAQTPPNPFRDEVLRKAWGLAWDKAHRCWHGLAESRAVADELRQAVAPHGGVVATLTGS
jgi:hypothetical protein